MKISIALCTYNGAKYLEEQLKSLAEQTLKADEIIICDDNSSDNTVNIIDRYKDNLNIKLTVNKVNLGVTKNFEQAVSLCQGDIIFLCDQDDVWDKNKVKIMSEKMIEEKTGICCCDGIVADENLKQIDSYTLWNTSGLSKIDLNRFSPYSLINNYCFTGMALCFRKNFTKYFMPISENAVHDEWIAFIISCFSKVSFVNQKLVVYRQHSEQKIGINSIKSLKEIWKFLRLCKIADMEKETRKFEDLALKLKQLEMEANLITAIENKIKHLKRRTSRSKFRFFVLTAELISGQYKKYSNGTYKAFLKDLFSGR
jgi:glycosyltransferase involved in cell wall biosynthesis